MIVDIHTHIWDLDRHLTDEFKAGMGAAKSVDARGGCAPADPESHWEAYKGVDKAVVLAFNCPNAGAVVTSQYVADYVRRDPKRLIGFASVDPNNPEALDELKFAHRTLGLRGLKLSSTYQNFHPQDQAKAYPIYRYCETHGIPILVHQGATIAYRAPLEVANPVLLERVAYDFPRLRLIVAHIGHPWMAETIVLIRKQPNVFADLSATYYRPWQLYNALTLAIEYGVTSKILFGTDWPFTTVQGTIDGLKAICRLPEGTGFPQIPAGLMDEIIYQNPLPKLLLD
jgi:predicted TIM-barrel fold metal-dependent hydrolase